MVVCKRVSNTSKLKQILLLQKKNSVQELSKEEVKMEGFSTVHYSFEILEKINASCPHIIAKDDETVAGHTLVMLQSFGNKIPTLKSMFETADRLLPNRNYVAMGKFVSTRNIVKKVFSEACITSTKKNWKRILTAS